YTDYFFLRAIPRKDSLRILEQSRSFENSSSLVFDNPNKRAISDLLHVYLYYLSEWNTFFDFDIEEKHKDPDTGEKKVQLLHPTSWVDVCAATGKDEVLYDLEDTNPRYFADIWHVVAQSMREFNSVCLDQVLGMVTQQCVQAVEQQKLHNDVQESLALLSPNAEFGFFLDALIGSIQVFVDTEPNFQYVPDTNREQIVDTFAHLAICHLLAESARVLKILVARKKREIIKGKPSLVWVNPKEPDPEPEAFIVYIDGDDAS
ncbi:MAG: hypothetical protein OXQ96_07255, partial [Alphaproteobacteria bacterium]|nr:hypothetical protein [Alphaproteobacteria bacterium]